MSVRRYSLLLLVSMAALCVSCGDGAERGESVRELVDMAIPVAEGSSATSRVTASPSSTPEGVESLESALRGSWAVEFVYSVGDHHTAIRGSGYVQFGDGGCAQDVRIETDINVPGAVQSYRTLLRGDSSGLLWRGSEEEGRVVWEVTPQRHRVWSPLTVSPGDIVGWPAAGVCGLVGASVSGGTWPVERLVLAASTARRSALGALAGSRSECVERWGDLMDDESRIAYEVGLFADTTYEVSVDAEHIRFVQDSPLGHRVFLELTRTSQRAITPVPTAEAFEMLLAAALPHMTCDELFASFLSPRPDPGAEG